MKRCPICKSTDLRQVEEKHTATVALRGGPISVVVAGIPGVKCGACGEAFFQGADLERADLLAAAEVADRGLREGAAVRFMRKALGLRGEDLAGLLDVTEGTVSRRTVRRGLRSRPWCPRSSPGRARRSTGSGRPGSLGKPTVPCGSGSRTPDRGTPPSPLPAPRRRTTSVVVEGVGRDSFPGV